MGGLALSVVDILLAMYLGSYSKEGIQLRLWLFAIILFLVSGYFSYKEFAYLANGRTSDAVVVSAAESVSRSRRGESRKWAVTYKFSERDGTERVDSRLMSIDYAGELVPGATFKVQYLPRSPHDSRVKGDNDVWMTIPFIACSLWMLYSVVKIWREYREYERASARD